MKYFSLFLLQLFFAGSLLSQSLTSVSTYVRLNAKAGDPLFTSYSATPSRSKFPDAMTYKADYYSDSCPVTYTGKRGGKMFSYWKIDDTEIRNKSDYYKRPVVTYSFPDMMIMEYQLIKGIHVKETFFVYSFALSLVEMEVTNTDSVNHEISVFPVLDFGKDSVEVTGYNKEYIFSVTHPVKIIELFTVYPKATSCGYYHSFPGNDFSFQNDEIFLKAKDTVKQDQFFAHFLTFRQQKLIRPHETVLFRYFRGTQMPADDSSALVRESEKLKYSFLKTYFEDNLMLFAPIPKIKFDQARDKIIYISVLNLARTCIFPAGSHSRFNLYSSTGNSLPDPENSIQLMDEALGLTGYVYLDPGSAQNAYRLLTENLESHFTNIASIPENNEHELFALEYLSRGLPVFNWVGLEIYKVTRDKQTLKSTYATGVKYWKTVFHKYQTGGIENSSVSSALANEKHALSRMAKELGKPSESADWQRKALDTVRNDTACSTVYNPKLAWNYISYSRLKSEGKNVQAKEFARMMINLVSRGLSTNHEFYEFYYPETESTGGLTNYFPDSIVAKLLIEENVK